MTEPKFIDTAEAARLSNLSQSYLNQLRCKGGGSPYLKIGRRCVYRREQFEEWLVSHQCDKIGKDF